MNWPEQVPYFTEEDVHINEKEYTVIIDGQIKRCAMGWLKELFVDWEEVGLPSLSLVEEAERVLRQVANISKYESIEDWNEHQTHKKIADMLNKTMKNLGYDTIEEIDTKYYVDHDHLSIIRNRLE